MFPVPNNAAAVIYLPETPIPLEGMPMQLTPSGTSEVAIFSRILQADQATLPVAAARAILVLGFTQADKGRMRELAAKARAGTLTPEEEDETTNYEVVGHVLSLWKSKARRSLKGRSSTNGNAKTHL
jgi:hypothetical protein